MGAFFVYIIKSSFCLALFYLFYRLLVTKETFHRFNRIGILCLILLSVLIPLVKFSVEEPVVVQQSLLDLETLLMMATMLGAEEAVTVTPLWIRLVLWGYLLGSLICGIAFLCSCVSIFRILRRGKTEERLEGGIRLVVTSDPVAPFSWMKWIVISRKDREEGGREIISHEMAHIRSRHSLDLLLTEICILFHWFNPAIWLFKQELQNIHEYEADEKVLQQGIDAKRYQLLLIKKAVGSQRFTSMANSFNHQSLKKRILMMMKKKSNPWARLKYAFVLPLAALAVAAFARPEISQELEKISSVKISEIVPIKEVTEQKKVETTVTATDTVTVKADVQPQIVFDIPLDGVKLGDLQLNDIQWDGIKLDDIQWGELDLQMENLQTNLNDLAVTLDLKGTLLSIDTTKMGMQKLNKISEADWQKLQEVNKEIALMFADKQEEIDRLIQEKQKEIELYMKEKQPEIEKMIKEKQIEIEETQKAKLPFWDKGPRPLILLDGVEVESIESIDPSEVQSISVLKDQSATDIYGEKGINGVVIITSKKNAAKKVD